MCCLFSIRISIIAVLTSTAFALDLEKSKLKASDSNSTSPSRKWISELFHDAESSFHAGVGVSDKCREDIELWQLYLLNQTVWAVQSEYLLYYRLMKIITPMDHTNNPQLPIIFNRQVVSNF